MAGLYHDFFIKEELLFTNTDYIHPEKRKDTIRLHDDFIWYLNFRT